MLCMFLNGAIYLSSRYLLRTYYVPDPAPGSEHSGAQREPPRLSELCVLYTQPGSCLVEWPGTPPLGGRGRGGRGDRGCRQCPGPAQEGLEQQRQPQHPGHPKVAEGEGEGVGREADGQGPSRSAWLWAGGISPSRLHPLTCQVPHGRTERGAAGRGLARGPPSCPWSRCCVSTGPDSGHQASALLPGQQSQLPGPPLQRSQLPGPPLQRSQLPGPPSPALPAVLPPSPALPAAWAQDTRQ